MYYISDDGYLVRKTYKLSALLEDVNAGIIKFGYKDADGHKSLARVLGLAVGPSSAGNQILYGLDLDKVSDDQEQILAKYLPDILKYDSPKKRYKALKYHPIISKMIPHLLDDYSEPSENGLDGGVYATWRIDRMNNVKYVTTDLKSYVEPTPGEVGALPHMIKTREPVMPAKDLIEPTYQFPTVKDVEPKVEPQPIYKQLMPLKQPVPVTAPQMKPIERVDDYNMPQIKTPVQPEFDGIKQTPAMNRMLKSVQKPAQVPAVSKKPEPVLSPISRPQRVGDEKIEEIDTI